MEYQPLTFNRWYIYPVWAYIMGWLFALSSIVLIPGWALMKLATGPGTLRQVRVQKAIIFWNNEFVRYRGSLKIVPFV